MGGPKDVGGKDRVTKRAIKLLKFGGARCQSFTDREAKYNITPRTPTFLFRGPSAMREEVQVFR